MIYKCSLYNAPFNEDCFIIIIILIRYREYNIIDLHNIRIAVIGLIDIHANSSFEVRLTLKFNTREILRILFLKSFRQWIICYFYLNLL